MSPEEIVPRRFRFKVPAGTARHWVGGDPASTHMLNAMSCTFPRGEKMFVDAVRAYRHRVHSPELRERVRRFIAQESNHSRAHESFNAWLGELGLPANELGALAERDMSAAERALTPEIMLAVTAGFEHFTAMLAKVLVDSPGLLERMDPNVRVLWLWHAVEELEHRSVAFDVYREAGCRESVRLGVMVAITGLFFFDASRQLHWFMRADGHGRDLASYARFARWFFLPGGHLEGLGALYSAYFRPDFHPDETDPDGRVLARARSMLEAALAQPATTGASS